MDVHRYRRDIDATFIAYQFTNNSGQAFRQDGKVPYANHAIWAATTILLDTRLPFEVRELGFTVLLYHDVLEDTASSLPDWVSQEAQECVQEMTYTDFYTALEQVRGKSPLIKLFTLVDKLSTLIEEHIPENPPDMRRLWKEIVLYLVREVEQHYGRTRIVVLAEAMAAATDW